MSAEAAFLGRGWSFPPSFTRGGQAVAMVAGVEDIEQALRILLATQPGERPLRENFGCDLNAFVFEERNQGTAAALARRVEDAILFHEPRVEVERVEVLEHPEEPAILSISIDYIVRATNSRYNLVYPFYLDEAFAPGA